MENSGKHRYLIVEMHESTEKHTYVEMSGRWVWRREENRGKVGKKKGREQVPSLAVDDEYGKESKLGGNTGKWEENDDEVLGFNQDFFFFFF